MSILTHHSEFQLVKSLKEGSVLAFNTLFNHYGNRLYQFSLRYLKSEEEAEEMVQEVFTRVWERRSELKAELSFSSYLFTIAFNIIRSHFLVIPFKDALNAYLVGKAGAQSLVITDALVLENGPKLELIVQGKESLKLRVYPQTQKIVSADLKILTEKPQLKCFSSCLLTLDKVIPDIGLTQYDDRHFVLDASDFDFSLVHDVFVQLDYRGDRAVCMLEGELATDNLYTSKPWQIGLKRYANQLKNNKMYFYFLPMRHDAPYLEYLDKKAIPDFFDTGEFLEINNPAIIPEYKVRLEIISD